MLRWAVNNNEYGEYDEYDECSHRQYRMSYIHHSINLTRNTQTWPWLFPLPGVRADEGLLALGAAPD